MPTELMRSVGSLSITEQGEVQSGQSNTPVYKCSFAPNPDRRHTRGKRGKLRPSVEHYTEVDAAIEELAAINLAADQQWAAKRGNVLRERNKRKNADIAAFRLRGFHGHGRKLPAGGTDSLVPDEHSARQVYGLLSSASGRKGDVEFARSVALRERLATNSEVHDPVAVSILGKPKSSRFPRMPWERKSKHVVAGPSATPAPVPISSLVARFKRTGDLPAQSVEWWESLRDSTPPPGVDGKALRRMIQAGLIASGLEENPGPTDYESCRNERKRIEGENITLPKLCGRKRSKIRVRCPICHVQLVDVQYSTRSGPFIGMHPPCASGFRLRSSASSAESSSEDGYVSAREGPAATSNSSECCAPALPAGEMQKESPPEPAKQECPPPPPKEPPREPPKQDPPTPPVPVGPVPAPPPAVAPPVVVAKPATPLRGFGLFNSDGEEQVCLTNVCRSILGWKSSVNFDEKLETSHTTLAYAFESRLAANRNVEPIKAAMDVHEVKYSYRTLGDTLMLLLRFTPKFLIRFGVGAFRLLRTVKVVLGFILRLLRSFISLRRFVKVRGNIDQPAPVEDEEPNPPSEWFLDLVSVKKVFYLEYVPHLVSSVLVEYDRGTSREVAQGTIRQKIRRLACLPIADEDAVQFVTGSEAVVLYLLDHGDFFATRAGSLRRLSPPVR